MYHVPACQICENILIFLIFLNHFPDNKSYLTTVMENEYFKPWKQSQLPTKRVSVPKKNTDFVTHINSNEETTSVESPGME